MRPVRLPSAPGRTTRCGPASTTGRSSTRGSAASAGGWSWAATCRCCTTPWPRSAAACGRGGARRTVRRRCRSSWPAPRAGRDLPRRRHRAGDARPDHRRRPEARCRRPGGASPGRRRRPAAGRWVGRPGGDLRRPALLPCAPAGGRRDGAGAAPRRRRVGQHDRHRHRRTLRAGPPLGPAGPACWGRCARARSSWRGSLRRACPTCGSPRAVPSPTSGESRHEQISAVVSRPIVWEPGGEPVGTGVVLPGRGYPPAAPGCAYAGYVLRAAGWRVRDVWWDPPANASLSIDDEVAWVGDQLASATAGVAGPVLVVGKSLGTYGARLAAERSYPAIWLTPVLTEPALVDAIRANPARQLLVGGTDDRALGRRRRGFARRRRVRRTPARRPRPRPHRPAPTRPLRRGPGRDHPRDGELRGGLSLGVRLSRALVRRCFP